MIELAASLLLISGALFMLVSAIGVVTLHDVYMRIHAITKAASLGLILMSSSVVLLHFHWLVAIEALLVVLFVILTSPVGSHMIARTAYMMNNPKGMKYVVDELIPK